MYYVLFTADGNSIELTDGDKPFLAATHDLVYGEIDGTKSLVYIESSEKGNNNHFFRFHCHGTTNGTYPGPGNQISYYTDYNGGIKYTDESGRTSLLW